MSEPKEKFSRVRKDLTGLGFREETMQGPGDRGFAIRMSLAGDQNYRGIGDGGKLKLTWFIQVLLYYDEPRGKEVRIAEDLEAVISRLSYLVFSRAAPVPMGNRTAFVMDFETTTWRERD